MVTVEQCAMFAELAPDELYLGRRRPRGAAPCYRSIFRIWTRSTRDRSARSSSPKFVPRFLLEQCGKRRTC